jgi:hypothetical protein
LNFDTLRPLRDVLTDYRRILERVYDPVAYAGRLERLSNMLDRSGCGRDLPEGDVRRKLGHIEILHKTVHKILNQIPDARDVFWKCFVNCARTNAAAVPYIVMLMAMYLHLGPFSRYVIKAIDRRIAALDDDMAAMPAVRPAESAVA